MMTCQFIPFVPKAQLCAQKNILAFIEHVRYELHVFGEDLAWDADGWDVSAYVHFPGKKTRVSLNFYSGNNKAKEPFLPPWRDFSRAYVRYLYGVRPTTTSSKKVAMFRQIITAMDRDLDSIALLTADDFDRTASLSSTVYTPGAAYNLGKDLNEMHKFLLSQKFLTTPFDWANPIKRPGMASGHIRVGQAFEAKRQKAMPSDAAFKAIPELYLKVQEPADVITASILALLHIAPMRISELLSLPVDCEHEILSNGEKMYGVRWRPVKGAAPQIKWIPKVFADLAKEALGKIKAITQEARDMAKWYARNDRVYLRAGALPQDTHKPFVSVAELSRIFGIEIGTMRSKLCTAGIHVRQKPSDGLPGLYDLLEVETFFKKYMPKDFPVFCFKSGLHYEDALFCIPFNFGRIDQKLTGPYPIALTQTWLDSRIARSNSRDPKVGKSIFERYELFDAEGHAITVNTHQFRHWLNTAAQREGLSQVDIAAWSGRKNVQQNQVYDHMAASELHQTVKAIRQRDFASLKLENPDTVLNMHPPISREAFLEAKYPAAHTTDLGICVHDFSLLPCQKHGDCINCNEQKIVKGDRQSLQYKASKHRLEEAQILLGGAEEGVQEGFRGSEAWLRHQQSTVKRLKKIVAIHEDEKVPVGTLMGVPGNLEDSEIRHALGSS